jgi:hypothetical protein
MHPIVKLGLAGETRLTSEVQRAEALLHDIAIELLRVPTQGSARELHVRALRLKRQVDTWTEHVPDATVDATIEQLLTLHREARELRADPSVAFGAI